MGNNEIMKATIFRAHFEAAEKIPDKHEQLLFLEAVIKYQLYGEMPENLPPIAKLLITAILPELEEERKKQLGIAFEKDEQRDSGQPPIVIAPTAITPYPWWPPHEVTFKN